MFSGCGNGAKSSLDSVTKTLSWLHSLHKSQVNAGSKDIQGPIGSVQSGFFVQDCQLKGGAPRRPLRCNSSDRRRPR